MTKRLIVFLLATLAFIGGAYALRGKKAKNRPVAAITTNIPSLKLDPPSVEPARALQPEPAPHVSHVPHVPHIHPPVLTPRLAGLVALAAVLCVGAYVGLGKGSETARAAVTVQDAGPATATASAELSHFAFQKIALQDGDTHSLVARVDATPAPPSEPPTPPPAPAPTAAVAAEVETPAPVAQPAAAIAVPTDGLEAIICALPWPCQQAINVAACESGRDMQGRLDGNFATNGNNFGLFQINGIHANRWPDFYQNWMDPAKNAQWAYEIYAQQGWYPWDCRWAAYY
jgi:hypothetical protein